MDYVDKIKSSEWYTQGNPTSWITQDNIVLIVVLLVVAYFFGTRPSYRPIVINGRTWNVIADYANAEEAGQLLARVHGKMLLFMKYLIDKYGIDAVDGHPPPAGTSLDKLMIVRTLVKNYNPDEFYENDPRVSPDTSYTRDKGSAMYICLRQRSNPDQLVSEDMLFFVILHEMAHIGNYNGWGHKQRFWQVFKFFLQEATASGIYTPRDYEKSPDWYCGLDVAYNPYFDKSVASVA